MQSRPATSARQRAVIIGAGPVGMSLALELSNFGVHPVIYSRTAVQSPHSKATIIWPRILELLERVSVTGPIIERGHCFEQLNYYSNKKLVGRMRISSLRDSKYPFGITIPQWYTEDILRAELGRRDIEIHYGHEFLDASQDQDGVDIRLKDSKENVTSGRCDWLIGADGFRSAVREAFRFEFEGFTLDTELAITDTTMQGEMTGNEVAYYLHRSGNMVVAPLGNGIFRVGASVPTKQRPPDEPTRDFFNALLAERLPGRHAVDQMRFSGIFKAHVRTARTFQDGRVFLVGDAAHAMSPSGAQGLNTGFQDAANLGWKLGSVMTGRLPDSVLATYSRERTADVRRVSALSTRLARMSLLRSPPQIALRDLTLRAASLTTGLDRFLVPRVSQLDSITDSEAGVAEHSNTVLPPGRRLPLGWEKDSDQPVLSKTQFTTLLWPGLRYSFAAWQLFSEELKRRMPEANVIDLGGRPLGRLRSLLFPTPGVVLVRPDGHIKSVIRLDASLSESTAGKIASDFNRLLYS